MNYKKVKNNWQKGKYDMYKLKDHNGSITALNYVDNKLISSSRVNKIYFIFIYFIRIKQ